MAKRMGSTSSIGSSFNRSDTEARLGINAKNTFTATPLTNLISAATTRCTYYAINVNETTYRNGPDITVDVRKSRRYVKIKGFVMYQRDGKDIDQDNGDDQRETSIDLASFQSLIIGVTAFVPKPGDLIVLEYQGNLAVPYQVINVSPTSYIDRECFAVTYAPDGVYKNAADIDKYVVSEATFRESALGTEQSVIVPDGSAELINTLSDIYSSINASYVDVFYDMKYDTVGMNPKFISESLWFRYVSTVYFQLEEQVLRFGMDGNVLFIENIPAIGRPGVNYNNSLFMKLIDKDFKERVGSPAAINMLNGNASRQFINLYKARSIINNSHRYPYISKYLYRQKFYFRDIVPPHSMLTLFYRSDFNIIDILDMTDGWDDHMGKAQHVIFELENGVITKLLDAYMDDKTEEVLSDKEYIKTLKRYAIDKDNIDDYIGIPMFLYVLKATIDGIVKAPFTSIYTLTNEASSR